MKIEKLILTIKNNEEFITANIEYNNGCQEEKLLRDTDVIEMLEESYEPSYVRIGELPRGYVDAKMGFSKNTFNVCIRVEAGIRCMHYYGDEYFIPFPECIFLFSVLDGKKNNESYVYASDGSNKLYHYPFGNVYNNHKICWGRTQTPEISCMKEVELFASLFFGSETNNDLYTAGVNVAFQKNFMNQRGLFEYLSDKEEFPNELLVAAKENLQEVLDKYFADK